MILRNTTNRSSPTAASLCARRRLRWPSVPVGLVAGSVAAFALGVAASGPAASPTMSTSEIEPGMKGHGLTVFAGTQPERFGIEVISTLHNFRPNQDLIIIKTFHPRLEVARTVAGMSGSPIYVGDRIIGAYAYGWFFGREPVAGVTPIDPMLAVLRRPLPPALAPVAGYAPLPGSRARPTSLSAHAAQHRFVGPPLAYDLHEHAAQLAQRTAPALAAPAGTGLGPASTPILVGGFSPGALRLAKELLEPVGLQVVQAGGSGGRADPNAPRRYVDGGPLAVQLVRGDMSASALGTVTHVVGNKLIAFGHPMLNGGIERLPTALGKVHWIMATENRSFKIGEPTRPLGALVNDRQAAVVVDMSQQAPTFPIHLDIKGVPGAAHPVWNVEVAHDKFLAPNFTAMALGSAMETTTSERNDMTWRARNRVHVAGHGSIEIHDFGSGNERPISPHDFARSRLVRALGALLNNPWQDAQIERIDTRVEVTHRREVLRLRGAQVLESEIDVGQPARIRLTLERWQDQTVTRIIEVPIDPGLAGETVEIKLDPGHSLQRPLPAPESFSELLAMIPKQYFDDESIVASYKLPEASAAFRGKVANRLPPGAADTLRPTTQSVAPEVFAATKQVVVSLGAFLTGTDTVRVQVRDVLC